MSISRGGEDTSLQCTPMLPRVPGEKSLLPRFFWSSDPVHSHFRESATIGPQIQCDEIAATIAEMVTTGDNLWPQRNLHRFMTLKIPDTPKDYHLRQRILLAHFSVCLLLLILAAGSIQAQPISIHLPLQQRSDLLNGLRVVVVERPGEESVSVVLATFAGAAADETGKEGTAWLTARMLLASTPQRKSAQIAEDLGSQGFHPFSNTDYDASWFRISGPAKEINGILDEVSDLVLTSDFDEKELAQLKQKTEDEEQASRQDAGALADLYFHEKLFGPQAFGLPPEGIPRTIKEVTASDCKQFYQRFYHPNNSMLLIVGGVHADDVVSRVRSVFGAWKNTPSPPIFPRTGKQPVGALIRIGDRPGSGPAQIRLGRIGVQRTSRDYYYLEMLNFILGGEGFDSRFSERLQKNDHLASSVSSAFEYHNSTGDWVVRATTTSDQAAAALADLIDEIKKIRNSKVSEKELTDATVALNNWMASQLQSDDQIAENLAKIEVYSLAFDTFSAYGSHLSRVTADEVQQAARQYLDPDSLVVVVVGDAAKMKEALQKLGTVEVFPGT